MSAALLEAHGRSTGAYISPHIETWTERVEIGGRPIGGEAFSAAVGRAAEAAEPVNRTLEDDDSITQFELLTAAAFVAFATAGIEIAVIEAGLGGRLDATNVLPSRVTALTSIGLEHTKWLGETEAEIAAEKLAVLGDRSTLVLGSVSEEVLALGYAKAAERHARVVEAAELTPELKSLAQGRFQHENLAVALASVEATIGPLDSSATRAAIDALKLPGRLERLPGEPPLFLDAAHNPAGAAALAAALPELVGDRPIVCCLAVLDDKDAAGIATALATIVDEMVCTEIPAPLLQASGRVGARSLTAGRLATICRDAGISSALAVDQPDSAVTRALELARQREGVALCAGSHYLSSYAWTARRAQS